MGKVFMMKQLTGNSEQLTAMQLGSWIFLSERWVKCEGCKRLVPVAALGTSLT
jgi:hypothetical protein